MSQYMLSFEYDDDEDEWFLMVETRDEQCCWIFSPDCEDFVFWAFDNVDSNIKTFDFRYEIYREEGELFERGYRIRRVGHE